MIMDSNFVEILDLNSRPFSIYIHLFFFEVVAFSWKCLFFPTLKGARIMGQDEEEDFINYLEMALDKDDAGEALQTTVEPLY